MKKMKIVSIALVLLLSTNESGAGNKNDSAKAWIKGGLRDCAEVVISPNGNYFLSITSLGTQVWSRKTGSIVKMLPNRLSFGNHPFVFSQDGEQIYYADSSRIICWSIEQDSILFTFRGHHDIVRSLCLSPDGLSLLSAGDDSLVVDWDLRANPIMRRTYLLHQQIWKSTFAGGGKYIAAVGRTVTMILDRDSGETLHRFENGYPSISSLSDVIAVADGQQRNRVVIPGTVLYRLSGKKIKSIKFPEKVRQFTVTADGKYLVSCSENRFLYVYDASNGNLLRTIAGSVRSPIVLSKNGRSIVAILKNSQIGLWDLENGDMISRSPAIPPETINQIAISENGQHVVSTSYSAQLYLWDTNDGEHIKTLTTHNGRVDRIVSNSHNGLSASLCQGGKVYAWETATGKNVFSLEFDDGLQIDNLAFSHNGKYIATIASRTVYDPESPRGNYHTDTVNVSLWEAGSGKWIKEYPFSEEEWPNGVAFTVDDNGLLLSNGDQIRTYDVSTGKLIRESSPKNYGSVSPQSRYSVAFSIHSNGDIALWNLAEDTIEFIRDAHPGFTRAVSIPDDETILVSFGQEDQTVKVWNIPQGTLRNSFRMLLHEVQNGCVSPSGRYFAGGSITGEVNVWDLTSGTIIQHYDQYPCYISCISWSPDDKLVFAGFLDGTIIAVKAINPN